MTFSELLLAIYATIAGVLLLLSRKSKPRRWRVVAVSGFVIVATALGFGTHRLAAVPMTVVALATATLAARRARHEPEAGSSRRGVFWAVGRWTGC